MAPAVTHAKPMTHIAVVLGAMLLTATDGRAASIDGGPAGSPTASSTGNARFADTADHVHIKAVDRVVGDTDRVVVAVEIDAGFHINANPASFDYLVPTTLNLTGQAPLRVIYPPAVRFKPKFADDVLEVYEGAVRIAAEFPRGSLARIPYLTGTVTAQACTDEICLPPADLPFAGK